MITINDLLHSIQTKNPSTNTDKILRAYLYAENAHKGQTRKSGEAYITHPVEVAKIIADLNLDQASIIASLLHDVVEDCEISEEQIEKDFGKEIATLVIGVTKLGHLKYTKSDKDYYTENLRKMFLAMSKDIRIIIIKLADRLHNMRTLKFRSPAGRIRTSQETLDIYAPLASRLGMGKMRGDLEDLAFQWVYPKEYDKLVKDLNSQFKQIDRLALILKRKLEDELKLENIDAIVEARAKHLYSLWKKIQRPEFNYDLTKIADLIALRIITKADNIEDCYKALGLVHQHFKPVPGRVSDYIAAPKANGYQSLHTKVFVQGGKIIEIQIRNQAMHNQAEFGVASHIVYENAKQQKGMTDAQVSKGFKANKTDLQWIKELTSWQKETTDDTGFLHGLKHDLFKDRIFVYTPAGEVRDLPLGSTPIDFAYSIHTDVGNRTAGAKVDGILVPLNYQLTSGEVIEISTSKEHKKPSRDWLNFVVTNSAKRNIAKFYKTDETKQAKELSEEINKERPDNKQIELSPGNMVLTPVSILNRIQTSLHNKLSFRKPSSSAKIIVTGMHNVETRMAKCCNPLAGDEIIGFITDENYISIHRIECPNVREIGHNEKQVEVSWDLPEGMRRTSRITIEILYRPNALRDITKALSDAKVSITEFLQLPSDSNSIKLQFTILYDNNSQKQKLYAELYKASGLITLE